jgi:hypothetical protein
VPKVPRNMLMGGKRPMATPPSRPAEPMGLGNENPFRQKGGKMKAAGIGKKARKVAEEVPTGPMKGIR